MVGVGHSIPLLKSSTISTRQPFAQGLADIEFVEERNVHIEYCWAEGDYGHKPSAYEVKAVVRRTWSQADIGQIEILALRIHGPRRL
jgi:hypothetical protein